MTDTDLHPRLDAIHDACAAISAREPTAEAFAGARARSANPESVDASLARLWDTRREMAKIPDGERADAEEYCRSRYRAAKSAGLSDGMWHFMTMFYRSPYLGLHI